MFWNQRDMLSSRLSRGSGNWKVNTTWLAVIFSLSMMLSFRVAAVVQLPGPRDTNHVSLGWLFLSRQMVPVMAWTDDGAGATGGSELWLDYKWVMMLLLLCYRVNLGLIHWLFYVVLITKVIRKVWNVKWGLLDWWLFYRIYLVKLGLIDWLVVALHCRKQRSCVWREALVHFYYVFLLLGKIRIDWLIGGCFMLCQNQRTCVKCK